MGYLTTFTIYNDGIDNILEESDEFCKKLHDFGLLQKVESFGHGTHLNLVKVQKTRHADDHTMYVHMGNSLYEMNSWAHDCMNLMIDNPEFFEELLKFAEKNVKHLRDQYETQKPIIDATKGSASE
ncbi:hypothetical protein GOV11_02165 [Candidatus Woesearchaeota archaeon]|nr:hypothetical protein [Candidatus Woesearchaeota archaeon]